MYVGVGSLPAEPLLPRGRVLLPPPPQLLLRGVPSRATGGWESVRAPRLPLLSLLPRGAVYRGRGERVELWSLSWQPGGGRGSMPSGPLCYPQPLLQVWNLNMFFVQKMLC